MNEDDPRHDGAPDPEAADLAQHPGCVPIRVISQRTGVNSVTLRAWERRYGLLKPLRTPKGHRLYREEDIARVLRILAWIDRGVSIGRVRALLARETDEAGDSGVDAGAEENETVAGESSDWSRYATRLSAAIGDFDANRLDAVVDEALSLYPFATVFDRLLVPAADDLSARRRDDARAAGIAAEQAFLASWLRRKLASRVQFETRAATGTPVLVVPLPGDPDLVALRALAIGCLVREVPPLLVETVLDVDELVVIATRRHARAVVLHGSEAQDPPALVRMLQRLREALAVPVAVAGPAARIHEAAIVASGAVALLDASPAQAARGLPLAPAGNDEGTANEHGGSP